MDNLMIHKLCEDISGYDGFVLYGAGYFGKNILDELQKRDYHPLYFVVSNLEDNHIERNGIPVYDLNSKIQELQKRDILIVISVTEKYENEIYLTLKKNNITNVVLASHYFLVPLNERTFNVLYKDKDFEWYISRIKGWHWFQYGCELEPSILYRGPNKRRIILVVENFAPRVLKISEALQKQGKEVIVLLHSDMKEFIWKKFYSFLNEKRVKHSFYNSIEELLFLLLENKGEITHIFSNNWNIHPAYLLVKFKEHLGKIVFENYDIANGFYTILDDQRLKLEQYCLENAHGVCYREYSLEYLINELNFDIKGKKVRFFDYCWDDSFVDYNEPSDETISLCYVGGVITEEEYPDCPFGGFLKMAELCEISKCHLHVYPTIWDEKKYSRYIAKDKESMYFHFHQPVDYDKLISEISRYDYGIVLTRDDIWEKERSGYNTVYKYVYSATNKFFDYIDAGLPIIAGLPLKMVEFLEEKGVLINWKNGQYDFDYLRKMKKRIKGNVSTVKNELRIGNHIGELLEFYDEL